MNRTERIDEVLAGLEIRGVAEDTHADEIGVDPDRFLLVERNVGSAAYMQSHWFTTHDTLQDAGEYHVGQEYAEDWEIEFAVDLDTGVRHQGDYRVEWTPPEPVMLEADYQGETWIVHGYEWLYGKENREQTMLKRQPKDRRRRSYDWLTVPTDQLENIKWSTATTAVGEEA